MATLRWRKVQPVTHSIQFGPVERHHDRVDKFGRLIVELGSRLIKSTTQEQQRDRRKPGNFVPAGHNAWRFACSPSIC